MKILIHCRHS